MMVNCVYREREYIYICWFDETQKCKGIAHEEPV